MEPTEAQYLVLNALETLELLRNRFYSEDRGVWYIETLSPVLPYSILLRNGDIVPITWGLEL